MQVTLRSVTFRGATALPAQAFEPTYRRYVGAAQPVAVICAIRDNAARLLFDHGVLARVEIPEQRIADGALTMDVIEAHVVNVRVRGDIGDAQGAVERYVENLRGMKPFDMRRAQRYLLLASDIPGVHVRAAVRPSTSPERGAVDLDVAVTRDGLDVLGGVQNLGSRAVGPWGVLARADLMSATAFGERTSLVAFRTVQNEQWVVQGSEEARFGGEGLVARGSVVYGESRPGGSLKPLDIHSKSFVVNAEAAYPLVRLRRMNLNLAGGFEWVDQKSLIGFGSDRFQDRLRIGYLRADGDYRLNAFGRPMLFDASATIRKGFSGLGATDRGSPLATRNAADPAAWLLRGEVGLDALLTRRLSAAVRMQGQYAAKPLFAYEQLAMGALTVGRGYDPAAVLGDSGVAASFELRYAQIPLHEKVTAAPFLFYDVGQVRNHAASGLQRSRTLQSVGAGVNLRLANRANLGVTYAKPLESTGPNFARPGSRLLVRLTAAFR